MTEIEQAQRYAAQNAVEYLQEINEYDLRKLGEERFKTLIEVITENYHNKFAELEKHENDIPF